MPDAAARRTSRAVFEGDTRAHYLVDKGFAKRRHRPVPQREDHDEVFSRREGDTAALLPRRSYAPYRKIVA
jgi:hypothetical protein